jgi:hypothetical protein
MTLSLLDIVAPILLSAALLWWVSRGMPWRFVLVATAITLAVIVGVVAIERNIGP